LSICLKLISREIIFEVLSIPAYVIPVPERHRETDDILCHNRALRSIAR